MVVMLLGLFCLVAAACSTVSSQEASRANQADPSDQGGQATDPTVASTLAADDTPTESSGLSAESDDDADSTGDRGSRIGADQDPNVADASATNSATDDDEPQAAEADEQVEEPTPIPTATPSVPPTPEATAVPIATATPVPIPVTSDPDPAFTAPAPTGSVPSDDIVVQGPTVDESEPVSISENGAAACALAERAIDFLDRGDADGTASALQEASEFAEQAAEAEIAAVASQLATAGANETAAVEAIIAALNACAVHGYQV